MRVLLAEDDKRLGKLIQYMLEQNEIQVEWVTSGSDIYEYAMYTDYDILVLDWMMPGETGVDACSRLRRGGYEKAILMLTARDSVEDRVTGLDAGADDYLVKPLSLLSCSHACGPWGAAARRRFSRMWLRLVISR